MFHLTPNDIYIKVFYNEYWNTLVTKYMRVAIIYNYKLSGYLISLYQKCITDYNDSVSRYKQAKLQLRV